MNHTALFITDSSISLFKMDTVLNDDNDCNNQDNS